MPGEKMKFQKTSRPWAGTVTARARQEGRWRGLVSGASFGRSLPLPVGEETNLCVGKPPRALEIAETLLRQPRRHTTLRRRGHNVGQMSGNILIRDQREQPRFALAMAG
jgi:hypothetical protein